MTKDDDQVSDWTKGLPSSEELTPLSHTLITRILESAFRIKHDDPMTEGDVRRESQATLRNIFKQKPAPSFDPFPAFQTQEDAGAYGYGMEGRGTAEEFRGKRRVEEEYRRNRVEEDFRDEFRGIRRVEERRDERVHAVEDRMDYRGAFRAEIPREPCASGNDTTGLGKGAVRSNTGVGAAGVPGLHGSATIIATNTAREYSSTPLGHVRPASYGNGVDTNTHEHRTERSVQASLPYMMNGLPHEPYESRPEGSYGDREGSAETGRRIADFELEDANSAGGSMNSNDEANANALKRTRLVWTPQLHKRFVEAVGHLGIKQAVPKNIMQLMNVEGLTRENVASHLQKYRLYLKRMQGLSNDGPSASDYLFASTPLPPGIIPPGVIPAGISPHFMPNSSNQRDDGAAPFTTPTIPMPVQGLVTGHLGGYEHVPYAPMATGFIQRVPMPEHREINPEIQSRNHASRGRINNSQQNQPSSSSQRVLPLFPSN